MSKANQKIVLYGATRNIYPQLNTALKSLIANTKVDRIILTIEDDEFPYDIPDWIECRNVSEEWKQYFDKDTCPNFHTRFCYQVLLRSVYTKMFPEIDLLLSLDVDTIVLEDISGIFELPIGDNYIAACKETYKTYRNGKPYVNNGVCLYNLAKLRDGKDDEIYNLLNTKRYPFREQDVINEVCQGAMYFMPEEYNGTGYVTGIKNPKIRHYAGKLDWVEHPEYKKYEAMTWDEILT